MGLEAPPEDQRCWNCCQPEAVYRCLDCTIGQRLLCGTCCHLVHQKLPFHKIKVWTGTFFAKADLGDLGLTINLGHDGDICPVHIPVDPGMEMREQKEDESVWVDEEYNVDKDADWQFGPNSTGFQEYVLFVDSSGVYKREVKWCLCPTAAPLHLQLLQMQFYPASLSRPSTAFTFSVLDQFYIEAMEYKTTALKFYTKLRRFTNNSFPDSVPVCAQYLDSTESHYE